MTRPGQTGSLFTRGRGWGWRGERERNGRQEAVFLDWGKRNQHLKQKLWLILTVLETAFLRLKTAFPRDIPFMIGDCLSATTKRSAIKNSIFEKHFVFLCDKRQTLCGYKRYPIKSSLPEKRKKKKREFLCVFASDGFCMVRTSLSTTRNNPSEIKKVFMR